METGNDYRSLIHITAQVTLICRMCDKKFTQRSGMEAKHRDQTKFKRIHWKITKVSEFRFLELCAICIAQTQRSYVQKTDDGMESKPQTQVMLHLLTACAQVDTFLPGGCMCSLLHTWISM